LRLQTSKKGTAIIYADVDRMKSVNDSLGHTAGDNVLRAVAQAFADRFGDRCCRFGGEQFAAVALATTRADALSRAESVRVDVAALSFEGYPELRVTIRVGVAVCPENGTNVNELMTSVDRAQHEAKRDGGNCVRAEAARSDR
jgi:diguanylate cyclase (GGDEF)-like protein